jgi:DNA-directed RNA polymerase subunit M/transcription elongation factor TFIIS
MILDKNISSSKTLNRFKTLEKDFHNIHNNKYSYDLFIYAGSHQKSIIVCPEHGKFEQNATNHLQAKGCPICGIELRAENRIKKQREYFITKAKKKHANKYDYSKTIYNGSAKKCIFICKIHGEFEQLPSVHLSGSGCIKCGNNLMADILSANHRENFESKASKIHNNFYDYSNYVYVNNQTKGKIICPIHGEFQQAPSKHINQKQGCPKCGSEAMSEKQSAEAKKEFKDKAFKRHDGIYDYSKFFYSIFSS